jgi:hypothetical protein
VVFLVCHYLGEDIGSRLVEFVEVVLLRCGFLLAISEEVEVGMGASYQYCCQVRFNRLHLPVTANHGVPYLLTWRGGILFDHNKQRAVPPCHFVGFFVPEDQVFKILLFIPAIRVLISQELLVDFATSIGWRSYTQL